MIVPALGFFSIAHRERISAATPFAARDWSLSLSMLARRDI
jgi:hypothetical protein